jgi:steroid Delta-isomerase
VSNPLREHVERYNAGVRARDFSGMVLAFADAAELRFEGAAAGPFHGRAAIAEAYREAPPEQPIVLLTDEERPDGTVVGAYAWESEPGVRAGWMHLTPGPHGRIARLVITIG